MGNRELPGKPDEMAWSLSPSTREYKYVTENCLTQRRTVKET